MTNKWKIEVFVDEAEVALLVEVLDWAASRAPKREKLDALKDQIKLSWIEREEELVPPPSKWSKHSPVVRNHYGDPR